MTDEMQGGPVPEKNDIPDFSLPQKEEKTNNRITEIKDSDWIKPVQNRTMADVLDLPVVIKIGNKTYNYTSRTVGYLQLISEELINIFSHIQSIGKLFALKAAKDEGDESATTLTDEDMKGLILSTGKQGFDTIIKVCCLLLEPIKYDEAGEPIPPDMENLFLKPESAKWGLQICDITKVINAFINRDLSDSVDTVKKTMQVFR